jgi:hypothetical protein
MIQRAYVQRIAIEIMAFSSFHQSTFREYVSTSGNAHA